MIYFDEEFLFAKKNKSVSGRVLQCGVLLMLVAVGLTACGSKEKKAGQSLARVDGEDITVFQLNEELQRANVPASQQETAKKQLLESLIDRQLIVTEAIRNKIDRSPEVMGTIERAKAQIIAQSYLQGITAKITRPSMAEIEDYFQKHPEYFAQRKLFAMIQLRIDSKDFTDELKTVMNSAKSLDNVAAWLDNHKVQYRRGQLARTSADLPPEMSAKLKVLPKGQLFVVNEGEHTMLISLVAIKDSPVTAKDAEPQIAQYLFNKKTKDVVDTEIAHLRSLAKIEYLGASPPAAAPAAATGGTAPQAPNAPENKPAGATDSR